MFVQYFYWGTIAPQEQHLCNQISQSKTILNGKCHCKSI